MTVKVSVVLTVSGQLSRLEHCLEALLAQEFPAADYEIIVVDEIAAHETRQRVEHWQRLTTTGGPALRYLPLTGKRGPTAARNTGWRAAHGEIIAFTEADCIPENRWLRTGSAALNDDYVAISGRIVVPLRPGASEAEHTTAQIINRSFTTANSFYRRTLLESVGGFDERFTTHWYADTDLYFILLERHAHCTLVPEAVVMLPASQEAWGSSLRQQQQQGFHALLYKKHPQLYRKHIQKAPPWRYYATVGTLFLALLAAFIQLWLLSLTACAIWLFMTASYCRQRLHKTTYPPAQIAEIIVTSALIPPLALFWRWWGMLRFHTFLP